MWFPDRDIQCVNPSWSAWSTLALEGAAARRPPCGLPGPRTAQRIPSWPAWSAASPSIEQQRADLLVAAVTRGVQRCDSILAGLFDAGPAIEQQRADLLVAFRLAIKAESTHLQVSLVHVGPAIEQQRATSLGCSDSHCSAVSFHPAWPGQHWPHGQAAARRHPCDRCKSPHREG